jgi:membrane-bound inhibitor of C-type lysozyme
MRRLVAIAMPLTLLAACVAPPPGPYPGKPGRELTYLCDDRTTVTMHPGSDAIAVLNSGLELRLPQYPSVSGSRYSNGAHEFRGGGITGVWVVPQRAPVVCWLKQ